MRAKIEYIYIYKLGFEIKTVLGYMEKYSRIFGTFLSAIVFRHVLGLVG